MKRARWWALVIAIASLLIMPVLAAGCTGEGTDEPLTGPLREARQKWTAVKATDYTYTLRIGCF